MSEVTRKYVIIRDLEENKFIVGATLKDRFHSDIFGDQIEAPWRLWSAGYFTYDPQDLSTLRTHDRSVGFQIGPRRGDEIILRKFAAGEDCEFPVDEINALRFAKDGIQSEDEIPSGNR